MVICQKDVGAVENHNGVRTKPNSSPYRGGSGKNSSNSSSTHQHHNKMNKSTASTTSGKNGSVSGDSSPSKSCFLVPFGGGHGGSVGSKKKNSKKKVQVTSSAASTDQSSTAERIFNPTEHNDQQQLLLRSSNRITEDWYLEDNINGGRQPFPDTPFSERSSVDAPAVTPSPQHERRHQHLHPPSPASSSQFSNNNIDDNPQHLLTFPAPMDRSHQARRKQHSMHAYDGELEPEGIRGQEAAIPPEEAPVIHKPAPIPLRQFGERTPSRQMSDVNSTTSSQEIQTMMREFDDPNADCNNNKSSAEPVSFVESVNPRQHQQQHEPKYQQHPAKQVPGPPPSKSTTTTNSKDSTANRKVPEFRRSAPVNVDDSSFEDPIDHVKGIHAMGMEHVVRGEYDMALQAFSQVLQVYLEKYGNTHPLTASAYHNLGTVHSKRAGLLLDNTLHQRHCREQALLCFQAAARSARDCPQLGPNHPNVAVSLVRIGFLLLQSRQYQNAVITFEEALRIRLNHYGPTHGLVANLYNNLGVCHMHLQEFEIGRRYLQQALDIQKELLAQDESTAALLELADTLCNIGGLCLEWIRQQGPDARHALDAELAFSEALEVRTKVLGEDHALTNQVRSLHDMVRSIPLPKLSPGAASRSHSPTSTRSANLRSSPASSPARSQARSPNRHKSSPMSSITGSPVLFGRPRSIGGSPPGRLVSSPPRERHAPDTLSLPSLEGTASVSTLSRRKHSDPPQQRKRQDPPSVTLKTRRASSPVRNTSVTATTTTATAPANTGRAIDPVGSPSRRNNGRGIRIEDKGSTMTPSFITATTTTRSSNDFNRQSRHEEMNSTLTSITPSETSYYEATEESCLLGPMLGDRGQGGDLEKQSTISTIGCTSYARSTVSWSGSTSHETDRMAVLRQAREILDAHEGFMDSPQLALKQKRQDITHQAVPPNVEDGLAPLGGTWPAPKYDRICPMVLQDPEEHLITIQSCAGKYLKTCRFQEALHLLEIVLECQRVRNGPVHEDVGAALHNVGIVYLRMDEHYHALEAFEEAVRVRKGALGRDHPQVAVSLVKVGISLLLLKRFEDSLWIFREALLVRKNALGALHPATARIYNNIGAVHVELNELKEARRAFEAALDIQRNALVHEPGSKPILFGAATTLQNLGYLYQKRGLHEKAAMVLKEALGIQEKVLGKNHPAVLSTLDSLAEACGAAGREVHALKFFNEYLERLYAQENVSREQHASVLLKMSRVHKNLHDLEAQLNKLHLAVKVLRRDSSTLPLSNAELKLDHQIQKELLVSRQELEKQELDWVA